MLRLALALVVFIWSCTIGPALAAKKVAFVVGIDAYDNLGRDKQLLRAVNDARAVGSAFSALGFQVTLAENATRAAFNEKWQSFLETIDPGDMATVYFSGHGIEIEGLNYLLPRDVPYVSYGRQEQLKRESLSVAEFLLDLRKRRPQLTLLILDACRDHPLIPPEYKSASAPGGGLARMDAPEGTFIMYAAGAGQTALDRLPGNDPDQENSVYTRKLLPLVGMAGLSLHDLARRLRVEVHALAVTAAHVQTPAYYDGLMGRYCLAGCDTMTETPRTEPTPGGHDASKATAAHEARENLAWGEATGANRLDGYRTYLKTWPEGRFASQSKIRIAELERLAGLWEGLKSTRNLPAMQSFMEEASATEFGPLAAVRLKELETIEAAAWRNTQDQGLLISYEAFLAAWPAGFSAELARERILVLRTVKSEWDKIRASSDEHQVEDFVLRHGWTEFGAEATAQLIAMRRQRAAPDSEGIRTLTADEMIRTIDGATIRFQATQETLQFATQAMPLYRPRLGKDFLKQLIREEMAAEGAFKAELSKSTGAPKIEGIGGIVKSRVDSLGSLFLLQMHGAERGRKDVDQKDRQFKTMQVVQDAFGYVCIATSWHSILSNTKPMKVPERCTIGRE